MDSHEELLHRWSKEPRHQTNTSEGKCFIKDGIIDQKRWGLVRPRVLLASDPYIFHAFQWKEGQLVDLGSLPGGYSAFPSGISENGLIAGEAINGALDPISGWPEESAVFWKDGQILNLGTLGGYESAAGQVNSRGQTTGFTTNTIPDPYSIIYSLFNGLSNGTETRAYVWDQKHGMRDLGTLGGPDERGEVAGISYTSSTPNPSGFPTIDPFLWEPPTRQFPNGRMIDLGSLGGTFGGEGDGIALNNQGQVVGSSNLAGDVYFHAFLWTKPGPMQDLGTFGGNFGIANAVNEAGEVVGWTTNTGDQAALAFFWKNGTMTNLGTLPGDLCSYAHIINSKHSGTG
jgi:probable HAF family extracellular repeat protein